MDLSKEDREELQRLEESLLRAEVRSSRESVEALLDETFVEIGASGRVYDREQTLNTMTVEINVELPLPDFFARLLVSGVALLTYRTVQTIAGGERRESRRSSIWMKKGKSWKIVFHQGTLSEVG